MVYAHCVSCMCGVCTLQVLGSVLYIWNLVRSGGSGLPGEKLSVWVRALFSSVSVCVCVCVCVRVCVCLCVCYVYNSGMCKG